MIWLLFTITAAAGLIAAFSALVPAFEAPDEPGHFGYAQKLAAGRGLPVQGDHGDFDPELSQPPLYYTLQAIVLELVPGDAPKVPDLAHMNVYQNTTLHGNVNLYSHPAAEGFPWAGQILQLHAMRLLNLLFATVTILATYGIGREVGLSPGVAVAAAATLGLLPQFAFIGGALNADNAITATSALALLLLLRWLNRPLGMQGALLLGLIVSAAMLSKLSGLAVLSVVLAAMIWRGWRERSRSAAAHTALVALMSVALGGWWYARNVVLYRDALGWQPMLTAIGAMRRPQPLNPLDAAVTLLRAWPSAIGVFGWNNLPLPVELAIPVAIVVFVGVVGVLGVVAILPGKSPKRASLLLLLVWASVFAASLVRWVEVNTDAAQWRLLFPAFPALAVLIALGLSRVLRPLPALFPCGLGALSIASLVLVIRPAYTADPPYTGSIQHRLEARFGDRLELVGYDDPQPRDAAPGKPISLTLYWRALRALDRDEVVDLAALDVENRQGLKQSTWPQDGRAPTSEWPPGQIVRDQHTFTGSEKLTPGAWTLRLDVFEPLPNAPRLELAQGGTTVEVGRFLILPSPPAVTPAAVANFAGKLALLSHTEQVAAGRLAVNLEWQALAPIDRDYTVFVHVLDGDGKLIVQDDSQPGSGRFPTSLLPQGLPIRDVHRLDLAGRPAGSYQLELGLYDAQSGQRLSLANGTGDAYRVPMQLGVLAP